MSMQQDANTEDAQVAQSRQQGRNLCLQLSFTNSLSDQRVVDRMLSPLLLKVSVILQLDARLNVQTQRIICQSRIRGLPAVLTEVYSI